MILTRFYLGILKNLKEKIYVIGRSFELSLYLGFICRQKKVKHKMKLCYRFLILGGLQIYNDSYLVSLVSFMNSITSTKTVFYSGNKKSLRFSVLRSPFKYNQSREHFVLNRYFNIIDFVLFSNPILTFCLDKILVSLSIFNETYFRFDRVLVLENEKKAL